MALLSNIETRSGTQLSVRTRHGEQQPAFLFVHGLASNARLWDGVADRLAEAGIPSIAVDQRGHGLSQQVDSGYDFVTLAQDLVDVVQKADRGPVIAVGQSWGANVVVELAARYPRHVAGVGLIDGGFLRLADDFPTWEAARKALAPPILNGVRLEDMRHGMRSRLEDFDEAAIEAQLANFAVTDAGTVRARLKRHNHFAILEHLWAHDPDAAARTVAAPILVIAVDSGSSTKAVRVDEFAAAGDAEVRWMEGHHDIHAQQPDLVAATLTDWAAEVLP